MPPFYHLGMVLPRPLPGFSGIVNQPPLTIPVNISPPFNMVPPFPPLHLFQANVPSQFSMIELQPNFPSSETYTNSDQRLVQEAQQNHPVLNKQLYYQWQVQMQHHRDKPS
uniref:(northern house mosquito) hypothetical protein n=1 Tax=Culex pipiens TaxID=7175 RepID=A0A8D8AXU0_CULPI